MSVSPLRAVARVAWRQAWRARARSTLVVTMVALPIGGLCTAAVAIRTAAETPEQRVAAYMGSADLLVYPSKGVGVSDLKAMLPSGSAVAEWRSTYTETTVGGSYVQLFLAELSIPAGQPPGRGLFALLDGRFPSAAGEAAASPTLLDALQAEIGDSVSLQDADVTFRVVGTAVQPNEPTFPHAILGPGSLDTLASARPRMVNTESFLVDLAPGTSVEAVWQSLVNTPELQGGVSTRAMEMTMSFDNSEGATGWSFAVTSLLLLATGMIAAAAFAVGARRQLRTLGLLGAAGGEPRHVRATVVMGGVALGFVGGLAGVALGVAGGIAIHPHLDWLAGRIVGPVRIPVLPLVGAVALGTLAGAFAALGPARSAGRLTTTQALAGRLPTPRRPGRIAAVGMVAVGIGAAITALATPAHSDPWLVLGLGIMTAGFLVAIPLLVTWTGLLAGRLPTVARLSTRDIARHGRRTGAAIAAAVIALAVPVGVSAITLSQEALDRRSPQLADDQLMIELIGRDAEADPSLLAEFKRSFRGSVVAPLTPVAITMTRGDRTRAHQLWVQGPEQDDGQGGTWFITAPLRIGGADLLRALHAERAVPALEQGKIVGFGPDSVAGSSVDVSTGFAQQGFRMTLSAVAADVPRYELATSVYVVSPARAEELGFSAADWDLQEYPRYVLRADAPLDDRADPAGEGHRRPSAGALGPGGRGLPVRRRGSSIARVERRRGARPSDRRRDRGAHRRRVEAGPGDPGRGWW